MSKTKTFPFERARRATPEETEMYRQMIENPLGVKRPPRPGPGRPPKLEEKFKPVSIRLHPKVLAWAKKQAKRKGVGYQTIINQALLKLAA